MRVLLDFDGTMVEHTYPSIGRPVPHSDRVVHRLIEAKHHVVLNTYRANISQSALNEALLHLNRRGIFPHGYLGEKMGPGDWDAFTLSSQEDVYIDDVSHGIPLIAVPSGSAVDWLVVERQLEIAGLLPDRDNS